MKGEREMENDALPNGWAWSSLGDIADVMRQPVTPADQPNKAFNYLSIENIESNTGKLVNFAPTTGDKIRSAKLVFTTQDVLYCKLRPYLNKVYLPTFEGISATDLLPLRPKVGISREFIAYFLRTHQVVEYSNQRMRGIQLPRLTVESLLSIQVPVPPSAEQRRMVAKIEEISRELRTTRESLQKVTSIMLQLRQSILARAFRGELTNRVSGEKPVEAPLNELRRAREERNHGVGETRESNLYDLPEGWVWVRIGDLTESSFYGPRFAKGDYSSTGVMTIRTTDMNEYGQLILRNPPRIQLAKADIARFGLQEGDLLVTRSGSIGKCAIFKGVGEPAIPSAYLIRFRLLTKFVLPVYVLCYLLSATGQELLRSGSTAVTQSNVNAETVKKFPIPICSIAEQARVVRELDRLINLVDNVQTSASITEANTIILEQSVLAKAFRGELVPQDPNDEPVSALLERFKSVPPGQKKERAS